MLALIRAEGQITTLTIDGAHTKDGAPIIISIRVERTSKDKVRLSFSAPEIVAIHRQEAKDKEPK